jgi:AcrR family transcriptional regulator
MEAIDPSSGLHGLSTSEPEDKAAHSDASLPARPRGSRREERKAETRRRLLAVAGRLFVEHGYENTTFDQIAQEAEVSRQTVFNYFAKKDDFVIAWGEQRRADIADILARSAEIDSAVARLILAFNVIADYYERNSETGRVFTIAWVKSGGPIIEQRALADQLSAVLADGQRTGEIRPDIDVTRAGHVLRAGYFDALWAWAAPDRQPGVPSLFDEMLARMDLILGGLCPATEEAALRRAVVLAQSLHAARSRTHVEGSRG